jgi:hypothetical protein
MPARHALTRVLLVALALSGVISATAAEMPKKKSPYIGGPPASARAFYADTWGVDQLTVKLADSGQLVRFDFHVVDAGKAAPLNDRASEPFLLDEAAHVALSIPTMEKVGPLRQSMPPQTDKTYWMLFSNKGGPVKPGHRVSVVIGSFRVDGLVVQ